MLNQIKYVKILSATSMDDIETCQMSHNNNTSTRRKKVQQHLSLSFNWLDNCQR